MYGQQNQTKSKSKAKNKTYTRKKVSNKVSILTYVLNHTIHKSFKSMCNCKLLNPDHFQGTTKKYTLILLRKNITVTN